MPELPEVEGYRALAESRALERVISSVDAPDSWYLKRGLDAAGAAAALVGRRLVGARRLGKLMLLDSDTSGVLGIHFGMSGRLLVDGVSSAGRLLYSPADDGVRYDRFALRFADGGSMSVRDPRRLGGVELDPDEDRLGPDALTVSPSQLKRALENAHAPLKARLLDQARLAGVGNLIADEILWRAGLSPAREARSLTPQELRRLHRHLTDGIRDLIERGGSHTGDLQPARARGGRCPRDGSELARATVGGRTTFWCPSHQR